MATPNADITKDISLAGLTAEKSLRPPAFSLKYDPPNWIKTVVHSSEVRRYHVRQSFKGPQLTLGIFSDKVAAARFADLCAYKFFPRLRRKLNPSRLNFNSEQVMLDNINEPAFKTLIEDLDLVLSRAGHIPPRRAMAREFEDRQVVISEELSALKAELDAVSTDIIPAIHTHVKQTRELTSKLEEMDKEYQARRRLVAGSLALMSEVFTPEVLPKAERVLALELEYDTVDAQRLKALNQD